MKTNTQKNISFLVILLFTVFAVIIFLTGNQNKGIAQGGSPTPTPKTKFDQKAAIAKLKEQIKGKEKLPASEVFKNVKDYGTLPAGRLLAIMEFGFSRSLGVDCTHCHTPENWASEEKEAKNIARQMSKMTTQINIKLLRSIEEFKDRKGQQRPIVNCTTCHRGQVKPALNLGK